MINDHRQVINQTNGTVVPADPRRHAVYPESQSYLLASDGVLNFRGHAPLLSQITDRSSVVCLCPGY